MLVAARLIYLFSLFDNISDVLISVVFPFIFFSFAHVTFGGESGTMTKVE